MPNTTLPSAEIPAAVEAVLRATPFVDIHTHLFPASFGKLLLWGIDELLTYHYLEAELFRSAPVRPAAYWSLAPAERADLIWKTLFVDHTPLSEAARGVVAVLHGFGLDATERSLEPFRTFFRGQDLAPHIRRVFELAGVDSVVMTNDPLDPDEAPLWESGTLPDAGFRAALRLDRVLNEPGWTAKDARRLLEAWSRRIQPAYMAVSLPDSFAFPVEDARTELLRDAVLPVCRELGLPLSLMIGVRRQVNPALRSAGDASGRADLGALGALCGGFPDNRFLVSVLSRENQHELCVYARKFSNLLPFGCWWFLNNPSIVDEITRERIEMLGTSFIPQHSDARILEQLIYKWRNTRRTLAPILADAYRALAQDGGVVTRDHIQRDVDRLFRGNFTTFVG
ncbi:MAG TPA: hypothetical protein VGI12_06030 [Vicinamibacterales bacterium]